MAQTPVTGNLVNNGEPRDATDFYLNVWFYDPDTRYLHLGWQGYVGVECWQEIIRGCHLVQDPTSEAEQLSPYRTGMYLAIELPIAEPIKHHCGQSTVLAWNHWRVTSQQTNWQDRTLEPSVPNSMPMWGQPHPSASQAMTLLMRLPDNCCYGI